MWSYYGSKSKLVDLYPPPKFDKLIEPFAGSARYALKWFDRDVLLVDMYANVVDTWNWLKKCSKKDILGLPKLKKGDDIRNMNLSNEEFIFLSFACSAGSATPRYSVSRFGEQNAKTLYKNVSDNLFKIKHWNIKQGSYEDLENIEATWYIDPPYQFGGHEYKFSNKNINFEELAFFCKERKGQTIVCENTKADWLDFKPMKDFIGTQKLKTTEAIWSNIPTNYDNVQQTLF
jgi:site-specific DNA-adenine methylase